MVDPDRSRTELADDLAFVRAAVARGRDDRGAAPIYFLWAAIIGIGFALPEFAPRAAWPFWLVAGLGGGVASVALGYRHAARRGSQDPAQGRRQGAHWLLTGVALAVAMGAIARGLLPVAAAPPIVLAIVGLGYSLAGVHLHPPLRWAGGVLLLAAGALLFWPAPSMWTATGLAVALALAVGGVVALRAPGN